MANGYGNERKEGSIDGYWQREPQPQALLTLTSMAVPNEFYSTTMSCLLVVQVSGEGGGW